MLPGSIGTMLEQMLTQGKGLMKPVPGEDKGGMQGTLLKTGAAAGVLGLLLGSKGGRKLAGNAALLGGLGVLGKLAYDAYQKRGGTEPQSANVAELSGQDAETRAIAITRAMIAASRADGHIDEAERVQIDKALDALPAAVRGLVREELDRPLDARAVARLADSPQAGREMYLASLLVTGGDHVDEQAYLADLASALRLDPATVAELHRSVEA